MGAAVPEDRCDPGRLAISLSFQLKHISREQSGDAQLFLVGVDQARQRPRHQRRPTDSWRARERSATLYDDSDAEDVLQQARRIVRPKGPCFTRTADLKWTGPPKYFTSY